MAAMPRYYFHIKDLATTTLDQEGIELEGLPAVLEEATEGAREIMSERVRRGQAPNGRSFVVVDEQGATVLTLPFNLAIDE